MVGETDEYKNTPVRIFGTNVTEFIFGHILMNFDAFY